MKLRPHVTGSRFLRAGMAAVLVTLALVGGRAATAELLQPLVSLGPITVANGTATLAGSLGGDPSSTTLTVNGQPVGAASDGSFSATISLSGSSELVVSTRSATTGETVTTRIPLTTNVVGSGGVISPDTLDALEQAAISITKPVGGFEILDGRPLTIGGQVGDGDQLAGLSVNGAGVLDQLRPDGTFVQSIPGSSEQVTVTATDRQGVSQTTTYEVRHTSSVVQTPAGPSVAAGGAVGLRIAAVRYHTKGVKKTKRIRMVVTVKDRRGMLVRDAIVRVRVANFQVRRQFVRGGQQARITSRVGTASFSIRLTKKALGKRVFMLSAAKSPSAGVNRTTSVLLPRIARARR